MLTTPVTATLTALDAAGSEINHVEYSYDNRTWATYTSPITLPDGSYTFYYRSQDNKGNLEQTRRQAFKIDTRPPTVTVTQPTRVLIDDVLVRAGRSTMLDGSACHQRSVVVSPFRGRRPRQPAPDPSGGVLAVLRADRVANGCGRPVPGGGGSASLDHWRHQAW